MEGDDSVVANIRKHLPDKVIAFLTTLQNLSTNVCGVLYRRYVSNNALIHCYGLTYRMIAYGVRLLL